MKIAARDVAAFIRAPGADRAGILIYGADAMRVALRRKELLAAMLGEGAAEEMRLTRLSAADLRSDPARLADEMRSSGFFAGTRAVLVEDAQDGTLPALSSALEQWQQGDATVVVAAGSLPARSKLRKYFEDGRDLAAVPIYDDPASRDEIEAVLKGAGLSLPEGQALNDLIALGRTLDPGEFRQTMEKLAIYVGAQGGMPTTEEVAACAPVATEVAVDEVIHLAAEGAVDRLSREIPRLAAHGITPVSLCIAAQRHFRALHAASCHPQGVDSGLSRARPPIFGPRRDRMARQSRHWGSARLEGLLGIILGTDLTLRSSQPGPAMALVERMLIRIAMLHGR